MRRWELWAPVLAVAVACGGRSNLGLEERGEYGGGTGPAASGAGGALAGAGGSLGGGEAGRGGGFGGDAGNSGNASGGRGGRGGTAGFAGKGGSGASGSGGDAGSSPIPSDDTRLRSLTVNEGYLMPPFDPATLSYTVNVPRGTEHVTLEAAAADPRASVTIDGTPGEGPLEVDLPASGMTLVPIQVTAPSGAHATTTVLVLPELVDSTTYVKASNTDEQDHFGLAVAVSGNTLAVGASDEDNQNGGVNGDELDDTVTDSGAVYVYVKDNGSWRQEAYIKAAQPGSYDNFGYSVALAGDTLVVGAPGEDGSIGGVNGDETDEGADSSGAVYVFTREAGIWTQAAYLKAETPETVDFFGSSVALEEQTIVVGAPGRRVTLANGDIVTVAGMATVFTGSQSLWAEQATLLASQPSTNSYFGIDVGLSGDTVVVGAYGESSGSQGINGVESGEGGPNSGAAYVFTRSGGTWTEQAFLKASDAAPGDYFGLSVAIAGEWLVVGAPWRSLPPPASGGTLEYCGAAYLFARNGGSWFQRTTLVAANAGEAAHFGARVAMDGQLVAVAAPDENGSGTGPSADPDRGGANAAGAVYLFGHDERGQWRQAEYIKATNAAPNDHFGVSVSLAGDVLAVGADGESSGATGINGDQLDNSAPVAGAAYVYELAE